MPAKRLRRADSNPLAIANRIVKHTHPLIGMVNDQADQWVGEL
jgi:hypothetical protein